MAILSRSNLRGVIELFVENLFIFFNSFRFPFLHRLKCLSVNRFNFIDLDWLEGRVGGSSFFVFCGLLFDSVVVLVYNRCFFTDGQVKRFMSCCGILWHI